MIYRKKRATLTTKKLLEEMHMQLRIAGGKWKSIGSCNHKERGEKFGGGDKLIEEGEPQQ
jgi:hypothetical protein